MAKGNNQKLKLLCLAKILTEQTDEEHGLTMPELISNLADYGIGADRKTIYQDLEELKNFGLDIVGSKDGAHYSYRLVSRDFELAELKLLVDLVQSSKFITERKSRELIKKLESLASRHDARKLQRQVFIAGRIKTMNESIYYSVDKLHSAISDNVQIRFQYVQWNIRKEAELRHGGAWYCLSPWALLWDNEYYYLVAYDGELGIIKHFRVDKMQRITLTAIPREGRAAFEAIDLAKYSNGMFGMFGGERCPVTLECENSMAGAIIDRFGKDVSLIPVDGGHFQVSLSVSPSAQFFGWVVGLSPGVRITGPVNMLKAMEQTVRRLQAQYLPEK